MNQRNEIRDCLTGYFGCPDKFVHLSAPELNSPAPGYFTFGEDIVCFGRGHGFLPADQAGCALPDAARSTETLPESVSLSFNPVEAVENLRRETYTEEWRSGPSVAAQLYYLIRPFLPIAVRKHLQKFHLRNWEQIAFPHWPVDTSVDDLMERLLLLCLEAGGAERIPFIWFWPEGKSSCAIMTHDVEQAAGRDFCSSLMDLDDSYGIKASYQVVPEERYAVTPEFLQSVRDRGCEVLVHDLNHDGHLYRNREQFEQRARKINEYLKEYGAEGFRAGVLYRKQLWYDALNCAYDMSVPNVAHLDPQRGGCCTVMPYFLGNVLEIPVTTVQDYSLFHILNQYSIDLWKAQTGILLQKHGLMSFIVHPDYVMWPRERAVYEQLLRHLARLRDEYGVWMTTPGAVNRWWRQRAAMRLVRGRYGWRIEGKGSERARIAWASKKAGRLQFTVEGSQPEVEQPELRFAAR